MNDAIKIIIPTELVGSLPRPNDLILARRNYDIGCISRERLDDLHDRAVQITIDQLDSIGCEIVTDGDQSKTSCLTYPIFDSIGAGFKMYGRGFCLDRSHKDAFLIPRLIRAPFRYSNYSHRYLEVAKRFTDLPIKQTVIAASVMSMVYPIQFVRGYSHKHFLDDLINESEKDIRLCLERGAHSVQLNFIECLFALKIDPSGQLLQDLVRLNNRVLENFSIDDKYRLGAHICLGNVDGSSEAFESDYLKILPLIFRLHVSQFYLPLMMIKNPNRVLSSIRQHIKPHHKIYIGVINPFNARIETPEEICAILLQAAKYIPVDQLGSTDDCGFSTFGDHLALPRDIVFEKIKARLEGTHLAEKKLIMEKQMRIWEQLNPAD